MIEKLKTLKDFNLAGSPRCGHDDSVYIKDLKQEAIKRVKELENIKRDIKRDCLSIRNTDENYEIRLAHLDGRLEWIKHFFNISDEELK